MSYVQSRLEAARVFAQKYGNSVSLDAARVLFKEKTVEALKAGRKLNGNGPILQARLAKSGITDVELIADIVTIAASAAAGGIRGKLVERVLEKEAAELMTRRPDLVAAVNRQAKNDTTFQLADLQIVLTNGVVLNFSCQVSLWGGGAQAQRASDYFKKSLENETFYNVVSDPIPAADLASKRQNKTKDLFVGQDTRDGLIYATELERIVLKHSS